jgi:hypothetical protein
MLGLAFTMLAIAYFAAAVEPGAAWRTFAALALAVLGLALVHPFNLPVVLALFGLYTALRWLRTRRWPWPAVVATGLAGTVALPLLLYNYYAFRIEPFWSVVYGQQNTVPSPSPLRLLLDYGLVLLLAPLALRAWSRPRHERQWLALLTGVLAAAGLAWWAARLSRRARRRLELAVVVLALPTALFLYVGVVYSALANTPMTVYVATRAEWEAGEWLAARMAPDEIVLGAEKSGFWLAALIPGRVWLGHDGITYDVPGKRAVIDDVLRSTPAEAARILADHDVNYLFYGPRERAAGMLGPAPGLERVFETEGAEIYRVDRTPQR